MDDSRAHRTAEAFFEVKTYMACNSHYNKNNRTTKPPDRRAKEIMRKYSNRFKNLNIVSAEEVLGNGETDVAGPFRTA